MSVVGAPSSAGAYAPGQEEAPTALRAAGLLELLAADPACEVRDAGDMPGFRWRPDRADRTAQNLADVVATTGRVRDAIVPVLRSGAFALVLGGDCTVGVGTVAGSVVAGGHTGVVYLDMQGNRARYENPVGSGNFIGSGDEKIVAIGFFSAVSFGPSASSAEDATPAVL